MHSMKPAGTSSTRTSPRYQAKTNGSANNYQNEESETWIGEWLQKRQNRDQMVYASSLFVQVGGS